MAVRTITFGNTGVVDSGSADGRSRATETHIVIDGAFMENVLIVAQASTGTIVDHTLALVDAPALVVLPASPTAGQKVTIMSVDGSTNAIGVTGSHNVNGAAGKNISGAAYATRTFWFVNNTIGWVGGATGGMGGTVGAFTF